MKAESSLTVQTSDLAGYALVAVSGSIDAHTHPLLAEQLEQAVTATRLAVIVDMTDVRFCDSSGLNTFARAYLRADARGVSLVAAGLQDRVHRVFTITGLDYGVHLQPDVETAVRWLENGTMDRQPERSP
ncbi:anti-sigma factor antagonist [Actinomadura spongiicola]|uniref:Anti-sigma factor antagonist n=1 Tax=Actinomadura spongiicola TaxID=2303421 RepID=A0A372GM66_9ACTN|nr:STAS domain-containing protein [Actinomadura spongiicola]RFS86487.1 anti-sigma factor antagonist [Actinomadura spongiicola]